MGFLDDFRKGVKKGSGKGQTDLPELKAAQPKNTNPPKGSNALSWLVATAQVVGGLVIAVLILGWISNWFQDRNNGSGEPDRSRGVVDYPPASSYSWGLTECGEVNKAFQTNDDVFIDRASRWMALSAVGGTPDVDPATIYRDARRVLISVCRDAPNPRYMPGDEVTQRIYVSAAHLRQICPQRRLT